MQTECDEKEGMPKNPSVPQREGVRLTAMRDRPTIGEEFMEEAAPVNRESRDAEKRISRQSDAARPATRELDLSRRLL